jgi:predicted outer membrane protein
MTRLLSERSEREVMRQLAKRIELSQEDEVRMMRDWLRARSQEVTAVHAHHADGARLMPGMLTPEEMSRLERARGIDFDRLFLELMIKHHKGALTMVEALLASEGAAQDSQLFAFTSDITADQAMEIDRMDLMLRELSPDPRVQLRAGFRDAGEAAWNLERVATVPNRAGFFDPHAPAGRPIPPERKPGKKDKDGDGKDGENPMSRPGILSFANTDLAFARDMVIEGNYHGFNAYNVEDPATPRLLASVVCPGGQGDVSIHGHLLFMSVEETRARLDCGLQGVAEPASSERFRGVRIFDISDIRMPKQVAAVQTCRGSHTHTVVSDPDDRENVYVYGSGISSVRSSKELPECSEQAADPNTALFSIDVIQVPLARPQDARVVSRPRIFADPETGAIAGLWREGDHGPGTQKTGETNQCHDITAFPELGLAAGACAGNGILLDVSDPVNPVRLDQVVDPRFAYWHSATFNNDGTKVIFTDEWGGGGRPRCRASDPENWGANAIFDIVDRKLQFRSYYKMPAPQTEQENCVAHNGSLIPVPGRDVMVQAWYQGGISVFDFTDSSNPLEIAFFDRGPIDEKELILGGYWSAYWYRGFIYGTEIARGLDVLKLLPGEHLTGNEIEAASLVAGDVFNVQQQRRVEWPANPAVARAYLDQLERNGAIPRERAQALSAQLDRADEVLARESRVDAELARQLDAVSADLERDGAGATRRDQARIRSLAETVQGIAASLR